MDSTSAERAWTEAEWIEHIESALRTATERDENLRVAQLYSKATKNSYSVDLWMQYIDFIVQSYDTYKEVLAEAPEYAEQPLYSTDEMRAMFQQAVSMLGYHVAESHRIWNAFVEFELSLLQETPRLVPSSKEEVDRIRSMFLERLEVPHLTFDETFSAYSSFETQHANAEYESRMQHASKVSQTARKLLALYEQYEFRLRSDEVSQNPTAQLAVYREYINCELDRTKKSIFLLVKVLYERVLRVSPTDVTFWEEYILWQKATLNREANVLSTTSRAIAACPWSSVLQATHLRTMERFQKPESEWQEAFQNALTNAGTASLEDLVELLSAYCDRERRLFRTSLTDAAAQERFIQASEYALATMAATFPNTPDPYIRLERAYIDVIMHQPFQHHTRIQALYDSVLEQQKAAATHWITALNFDMQHTQDNDRVRRLFKAALAVQNMDYPETIINEWVRWEREHSSIDDYEAALRKSKKLLQTAQARQEKLAQQYQEQYAAAIAQTATDEEVAPTAAANGSPDHPQGSKRKTKTDHADHMNKERKRHATLPDTAAAHGEDARDDQPNRTLFLRNIDVQPQDTQVVYDMFKVFGKIVSMRIPTDEKGAARRTAFVEFDEPSAILEAFRARKTLQHNGQPVWIARAKGATGPDPEQLLEMERIKTHEQKRKRIGEVIEERQEQKELRLKADQEGRTLYVARLDASITDDAVREAFSEIAPVEDVRIMKTRFGESKGFAYVDMVTVEGAQACLALNGRRMGNRAMSVAIADSSRAKNQHSHGDSIKGTRVRDYDPRALFVTNITYSVTEDHLRDLFEQAGQLESLRMLLRDGKPSGCAFAEFADEASAAKAIELYDHYELAGRQLTVAVARPTGKSKERVQQFQNTERERAKEVRVAAETQALDERRAKIKAEPPKATFPSAPKAETAAPRKQASFLVPRQLQPKARPAPQRRLAIPTAAKLATSAQEDAVMQVDHPPPSDAKQDGSSGQGKDNDYFRNLFSSSSA
ncbi:Splicing factor [Sorochytrium milnesiophthora]